MKTRSLLASAALILLAVAQVSAAGLKWMTNLEEAKKAAQKDNKQLLVDFTGSDWCGYCIKLEDEVFTKPAFADFAKDYVLVRLDFPHGKKLSPSETKRNAEAQRKYDIKGFPAVLIVDPKTGEALVTVGGYRPGSGPEDYLKRFGDIKKPAGK